MLNNSTLPSSDASFQSASESGSKAPSVAAPSLMLITIGGKHFGYRRRNASTTSRAAGARAHRRLASGLGLEPDRELDAALSRAARAVVHALDAILDPQRKGADPADGLQDLGRQGIHRKSNPDLSAVADNAHKVAVENVLPFCAAGDEGLQEMVDGLGNALGLGLSRRCAELLGH